MRKEALIKILNTHDNSRTRVIKKLLEEQSFRLLTDDQDISLAHIINSLKIQGIDTNFLEKNLVNNKTDDDVIYWIITGTARKIYPEKKLPDDFFKKVPAEVFNSILPAMLDAKTIANLSGCHSTLYHQTKNNFWWKDQLLNIGCDKTEMTRVLQSKKIKNYQKLYRAINLLMYSRRIKLKAWEIYCLSGEPLALQHAVTQEGINKDTQNFLGETPLHLAALGRSTAGMQYLVSLGMDVFCKTCRGSNIFHYAAWGGSIPTMQWILSLGIRAKSRNHEDENALHYAALGRSVDAMKFILSLELNPKSKTRAGLTLLHYAAFGGGVGAMQLARSKGIDPTSVTTLEKLNILHYAAISGSVQAVMLALEWGIDIHSLTTNEVGVFHYAVWSHSIPLLEFLLSKKLDATKITKEGLNPLHYAVWNGVVPMVDYLISLGIDPKDEADNGYNLLHYAGLSDSVDMVKHVRRLSAKLDLRLENSVFTDYLNGPDIHKLTHLESIKASLKLPNENFLQSDDTLDLEIKKLAEQEHKPAEEKKSKTQCVIM